MALSENNPDALEQPVRVLQIIVAAMAMGVLTFLAIVVLLVPRAIVPEGPAGAGGQGINLGGMQIITLAALFMGASALVLSNMVPALVVARGRSQIAREKLVPDDPSKLPPIAQPTDAGRLLALYQNQLIIGAALAEGGAFFSVIAYMLERHPVALGLAIVLLGSLLIKFPTRDRVAAWLDQQLALVLEERRTGV
jgi:hypothetical protein